MEAHPSCAICNGPAFPECPCEGERLGIAVREAEQRALKSWLDDIREWVTVQARAQIQLDFNNRVANRKATHDSYLASLPYYSVYVQFSGRPPLHPQQLAQLQAQINEASMDLKRGIDADWKAAVLRYPEVLDYYYSCVDLRTPTEAIPQPKHKSRRNSDILARPMGKRRDSRTLSIGGGKAKVPVIAPLAPPMPPVVHPGYGRPPRYFSY